MVQEKYNIILIKRALHDQTMHEGRKQILLQFGGRTEQVSEANKD